MLKKNIVAANIGNVLEWYDYILYAYLAPVFALQFFPAKSHYASLLAAFAVFAAGYITRPLGAIVFGHLGDRYGRVLAMRLTFPIMIVCTLLLGLMPTYHTIGIAAPILITVVRLLQGFSTGGQSAGTYVYLVEQASDSNRGLFVSIGWSSLTAGILLGSLICLLVFMLVPVKHHMFVWRIPYLLSIVFAVVWWCYKKYLVDNKYIATKQQKQPPLIALLSKYHFTFIRAVIITSFPSVTYYMLLVFGVSFLNLHGSLSLVESMTITCVGLIFGIIITPFIGRCSDIMGRRRIMLLGASGMLIFSLPVFHLLLWGHFWYSLLAIMLLMLCKDLYAAPGITSILESLPPSLRFTGFALAWNIANGVFGGTVPLIALWLIHYLHNPIAPSYYLIFISVLAILATVNYKRKKEL